MQVLLLGNRMMLKPASFSDLKSKVFNNLEKFNE